jgi:hypothetical protein
VISPTTAQQWVGVKIEDYGWKESNSTFTSEVFVKGMVGKFVSKIYFVKCVG